MEYPAGTVLLPSLPQNRDMSKTPGTAENRVEIKTHRKKSREVVVRVEFAPVDDADIRLKRVMDLLLTEHFIERDKVEVKDDRGKKQ